MKRQIIIYIIVLINITNHLNGQTINHLPKKIEDINKPKLILISEVSKLQYCSKNDLLLRVKLTYINSGFQPVILDKNSKVGYQWRIKKIDKNLTGKSKEIKVAPTFNVINVLRTSYPPQENLFTVLKKDDSYSSGNVEVLIDINDDKKNKDNIEYGLIEGTYTLELSVITWYYPDSLINEFQSKLREKGILWTQNITSQPMEFEIIRDKIVSPCEFL